MNLHTQHQLLNRSKWAQSWPTSRNNPRLPQQKEKQTHTTGYFAMMRMNALRLLTIRMNLTKLISATARQDAHPCGGGGVSVDLHAAGLVLPLPLRAGRLDKLTLWKFPELSLWSIISLRLCDISIRSSPLNHKWISEDLGVTGSNGGENLISDSTALGISSYGKTLFKQKTKCCFQARKGWECSPLASDLQCLPQMKARPQVCGYNWRSVRSALSHAASSRYGQMWICKACWLCQHYSSCAENWHLFKSEARLRKGWNHSLRLNRPALQKAAHPALQGMPPIRLTHSFLHITNVHWGAGGYNLFLGSQVCLFVF